MQLYKQASHQENIPGSFSLQYLNNIAPLLKWDVNCVTRAKAESEQRSHVKFERSISCI